MNSAIRYKKFLLVIIDIMIVAFTYLMSFYFSFSKTIPLNYRAVCKDSIAIISIVYVIPLIFFGLYKSLWELASIDEYIIALGACVFSGLIVNILIILVDYNVPLRTRILFSVMSIFFIVAFRISFRIYRRIIILSTRKYKLDFKNLLIVGAGEAGALILKEIIKNPEPEYKLVGFIDDDPKKIGTTISGYKVLGNRSSIVNICDEKNVEVIIIAMPAAEQKDISELITICKKTKCILKIVPNFDELIDRNVDLSKVRSVNMNDLLRRDPILLEGSSIKGYIENKMILVTGGGGSIGSEICRQVAKFNPKALLILDIYENNAYDLQNELIRKYENLNLKVFIASVRDKNRIECILKDHKVDTIFHAAAHKHVPLMEANPSEAIKNNVFGTLNLVEAANKYNVKKFVLISTDKAVNPTNIMGASKRICEMIVQSINKVSKTEFVAVRFGNVLGSNGSVIPLFQRQIEEGGPITITDKNIIRYFMTIPEASRLVIQAGAYAKGGEIFVLDMGEPVKIYDLACDLIKFAGLEPNKDIEIKFTGLRPGEKLYEELLMDEEGLTKTKHSKIFIGKPMDIDFQILKKNIMVMKEYLENCDDEKLRNHIKNLVPTYKNPDQVNSEFEIKKF